MILPWPTRAQAQAAAELMKQLAHPTRLMIASLLLQGERSVGALEAALGIRQPALSQQLAALRDAGLVETRRAAKQVFYRLADRRVVELLAAVSRMSGQDAGADPPAAAPRRVALPAAPEQPHPTEAARFARVARSPGSAA